MRIGLIAMSGLRVMNPDLAELGITLPQFLSRGKVIAQLPSLALLILAACTPDDVEVEYHELTDLPAGELPSGFDLVAISSYTAMAYEMYELADRYRALGVPVVLGGLHVSQVPEEAKQHADAVCVGEAETTWARIVGDFQRGGKEGLQGYYREEKPGTYDLAHSPMPRYDLLSQEAYDRITVQTSRGCPWDCEFCGASKLYGPRYRQKPVEKVIAEIHRIKELTSGRAFIELADDNTFTNPKYTRRFLEQLQDLDIHWFTETDISVADDEALLDLLYTSGCRQVLIGLESPRAASLDGMDAVNWKHKQSDRYLDAIQTIQSHGVTVNGCFIVGNDGEDEGVFEDIRAFVEKSELLECQVTVLTPFPGTRLLTRLQREERLLFDRFWNRCTLFDVVFRPSHMTPEQLEAGHRWLMEELYTDEVTHRRRRHYVDIVKALIPD